MYKVIIVDDEPWTIIDIEQTFPLNELGFQIAGAYRTPGQALTEIIRQQPDLIITDIRMPGMSGIELMKKLREQKITAEFIVVSGFSEFSYAQEAIACGACGYCLKPLNEAEAYDCLKRAKRHLDRRNENAAEVQEPPKDIKFEQLLNYINIHFSEKLTLKKLSEIFHMHPNYCCNLFAKYGGTTFSQYLTEIRILEAQKLLEQTEQSLEQVAALVGFNDYFYFSKVFKKKCGQAPREYRRQHQQEEAEEQV